MPSVLYSILHVLYSKLRFSVQLGSGRNRRRLEFSFELHIYFECIEIQLQFVHNKNPCIKNRNIDR